MNAIGNHFLNQVRGQISCLYDWKKDRTQHYDSVPIKKLIYKFWCGSQLPPAYCFDQDSHIIWVFKETAASVPARVALEEANRKVRKPRGGQNQMHFYSIHVIAEYNLSDSEIICPQITVIIEFPRRIVKIHFQYFGQKMGILNHNSGSML